MSNNLEVMKAYRNGEQILMSVHDREDGTLYAMLETATHWSRELELDEESVWTWWELSDNVSKPLSAYHVDYVQEVIDTLAESI